jgi:hypothetical protein
LKFKGKGSIATTRSAFFIVSSNSCEELRDMQ